jgi:hydroxylysine kinase
MSALLDDLVEPFERADPAEITRLLRESWGLEPRGLTLLDTERDDSYRVDLDGDPVLVKVAHPNDPAPLLALQDDALAAIAEADPDLPVPRVIPPGRGPVLLDDRIVRVLSWLPGEPTPAERLPLRAGGETLARLSSALCGVDHPAADRILPWDLVQVPGLAPYTDDPELSEMIARFAEEVSPVLARLPRQVIHNDFHPGNVLADRGAISGVLDFGDIVRAPRVCDVGIALGYLIPEEGEVDAVVAAFVAGFEELVPLTDEERSILPGLVVGREVQRLVINDVLGRHGEGSPRAVPRLRRLLAQARKEWT